jgi:beta-lactamase class D
MKLNPSCFIFLFISFFLSCSGVHSETLKQAELAQLFAGYNGGVVMENVQDGTCLRYNARQCAKRLSPCSTFKILNSLIALETGVIPDAAFPMKWDGRRRFSASWNADQTMRSALANSVVWFYQELARRIGQQRMSDYLHQVHYGNGDISGGLTRFWLCSSLLISADEQVEFLKKLYEERLPMSRRSLAIVKDLLVISQGRDWVLRGKTGGSKWQAGAPENLGWFVGYLTKGRQCYVFALNIEAEKGAGGQKAKEIALAILTRMKLCQDE